jgi:O-glycosyl hydrolase
MRFKSFTNQTLILAAFLLPFGGCAKNKESITTPDVTAKTITISVNLSKTYQTIDNFGASDAWSCQFIGRWPDAKKNAMADLLFSREVNADGQPKGIGLSIWRFNIGAGSTEQGDQSGIGDEWRRAPSFLNADGTYNWTNQDGQLWFLQAAKARGVEQFLAFPNSPPVQFTINKKAYATSGVPNLAPNKFDAFAGFLTDVIKGVQTASGIVFDYISPVNEPQWDWSDGGQEGTPFKNSDISGIVKSLNSSLAEKKLPSKITVGEAGQYNFLYGDHSKPQVGSQIDAFFNPTSANYIGDLPSVEKLISAHSYFTTSPFTNAVSIRQQLANKTASISGLRFWQSEYCILGDNAGEIDGNKRDLGITSAVYLAKVIHNDLVNANAAAWHWWVAISPYDYKDGLIYVDKNKTDGNYYPSKMLWALGNYSRFIRPGYVRIDNSVTNANADELLVSSYKNIADKQVVTVIVNSSSNATNLKVEVKNGTVLRFKMYTTSVDSDLKPSGSISASQSVAIPAYSVTTLTGTYQ